LDLNHLANCDARAIQGVAAPALNSLDTGTAGKFQ